MSVSYELGEPAAYLLAYEEGKRTVAHQAETLKETRDRVGGLLSAAVVSASLAAGVSSGGQRAVTALGVFGIGLAAVGFMVIAIAGVAIWLPFHTANTFDSQVLVGAYADPPRAMSLAEMHRELALWLSRHGSANRVRLKARLRWFSGAVIGFLLVALGLLLVLADVAH